MVTVLNDPVIILVSIHVLLREGACTILSTQFMNKAKLYNHRIFSIALDD